MLPPESTFSHTVTTQPKYTVVYLKYSYCAPYCYCYPVQTSDLLCDHQNVTGLKQSDARPCRTATRQHVLWPN